MMASTGFHVGSAPSEGDASRVVASGLERAAEVLQSQGIPVPELGGKLLRPTIAYAMVPPARRDRLDDRFWLGALAIQMVHEASLLHDDVLDDAAERRGIPTVYAREGVASALVKGDHYLTAAYRAAAWTRCPAFLERFITAVERTVAGEVRQGLDVGEHLDLDAYFSTILGKSGELLGASAALGACLLDLPSVDERAQLGLQLGALYQQVDDLLDYSPTAGTGKEPLKDYRQRKWTWVLALTDVDTWELSDGDILEAIFGHTEPSPSVAHRAIVYLEVRRAALLKRLAALVPGEHVISRLMDEWIEAARQGVAGVPGPEGQRPAARSGNESAEAFVVEAATRLGGPAAWRPYFRAHARTFSLAARLFPVAERRRVEALYAYCRFTDDLVDDPEDATDPNTLEERLEVWRQLSHNAFLGGLGGIPLLDAVMGDAATAGVDWLYPQALLDGVGMDLRPTRYADWKALSRYTFGVAGAVGGWMTRLFGIHDADTLNRAHALGHAMQLTNILRDVGEDLDMGRLYLPTVLLEKHGFTSADLDIWRRSSGPLPERYADAMRELMVVAEERYSWASPGIRSLPAFFRRPVAVAASAYRGIHHEVRRNGFDNLRLRAHTSTPRKAYLGWLGLVRASRRPTSPLTADEGLVT